MSLPASTAASAVYADALVTARRFRLLCVLAVLFCLVGQIALFFLLKFDVIDPQLAADGEFRGWIYFATYASQFLGLVFSILTTLSLLFIVLVMLSGRTVGVVLETKAVLWSLLVVLLMVPWQSVLVNPEPASMASMDLPELSSEDEASTDAMAVDLPDRPDLGEAWRVPGVLYNYYELDANLPNFSRGAEWLGWARFAGWPGLATLLTLMVWGRSAKGVRQALGEDLPRDGHYADEPMN